MDLNTMVKWSVTSQPSRALRWRVAWGTAATTGLSPGVGPFGTQQCDSAGDSLQLVSPLRAVTVHRGPREFIPRILARGANGGRRVGRAGRGSRERSSKRRTAASTTCKAFCRNSLNRGHWTPRSTAYRASACGARIRSRGPPARAAESASRRKSCVSPRMCG